ncbi:MAG: hypothetical protein MI867_04435 [Pseudomonadales bacterium]|nr:hypothetical protein [Pseudomonadales bacterium]
MREQNIQKIIDLTKGFSHVADTQLSDESVKVMAFCRDDVFRLVKVDSGLEVLSVKDCLKDGLISELISSMTADQIEI